MSDIKVTVESGKTYLGVVEENKDPERQGRCRVRVLDVHDGRDGDGKYLMPTESLPWALPWKDLNGNVNNVPDKGKVVIVVFENGKSMNPEYIHSKHYNTNLEQKLKNLSESDYTSMKSLIFDHKTQIYVNDSEGLKIDHKFNNINITKDTIDVNLKDNFGKINLGTARSEQRAILGDNFTEWFDKFLNLMLTNQAFIGNFAAPIVPSPKLMKHIRLYKSIKDPKILSKNVFIVDNDYVQKLDRIADPTLGDNWQSTVEKNEITTTEKIDYQSQGGASTTTFPGKDGETNANSATVAENAAKPATEPDKPTQPVKKDMHPDVKIIQRLLTNKNYEIYSKPNQLNIIAIRRQCLTPKATYTDEFTDKLYAMTSDANGEWSVSKFNFSTVAGSEFTLTRDIISGRVTDAPTLEQINTLYVDQKISTKKFYELLKIKEGIPTLVPSQYKDSFEIGNSGLKSRAGAQYLVWYDNKFDRPEFFPNNMAKPVKADRTFYITKGFPGGKNVGHWGLEGNQCLSNQRDFDDFMLLCDKHQQEYGNSFTYTLATQDDWENATIQETANKIKNSIAAATAALEKSYEKKDEPVKRPSELGSEKKILAFQLWANKNGKKLVTDGKWGPQTSDAWDSLKSKFTDEVYKRTKDENIWLGLARLAPYGDLLDVGQGKYIFKSKFNNNRYSILLTDGTNFSVFSELANKLLLKGTYEDGCRILNVTDGYNKGKKFKDDNAWNNVRKTVS